MADQPKRVKVIKDGVVGTIPADQLGRAMQQGVFPVDESGGLDRSWYEKGWDYINKGLASPDAILRASGAKYTMADLAKERDVLKPESSRKVNIPGFGPIDMRTFNAGVTGDLAKTASSLTSPASLATAGVSQAAKIPGAVGKVARSLLAAQGVSYGAEGAGEVLSGLGKGYNTPEGAQQILSGGAQVAGAAPAAAQMGRAAEGAINKVLPGIFAREERAFLGALRPTIKNAPALRAAYNDLRGELQKSNVKDFIELRDFAEKGRKSTAAETAGRIFRRSPTAGNINATLVGDRVRQRVTPWMKLRTTPTGQLPAEAQMILGEATSVEKSLLRHPMNIVQAEQVVQDINAELNKFRKLPPDAQYQAIRSGDPVSVMTAVKEALQEQIDHRVNSYTDLKRRYGSYKELQQQTERRMDQLDRESGQMDWASRRLGENVGSMMGAIFSGNFLHGLTDIFAGRAAGDVMIEGLRRPERMLQRGVAPPRPRLPFAGQVTQTVAAGQGDQQ